MPICVILAVVWQGKVCCSQISDCGGQAIENLPFYFMGVLMLYMTGGHLTS
jgi:hypothetical protein